MIKKGKIIKALSGFYYVLIDNDIIKCRARGNFRNLNITPLVGDVVKIKLENNSLGYVVEIEERKNELLRPKISNIDYNIIFTSLKDPDFSSTLLDKLITLNEYNNINTIIIFTKWDLLSQDEYVEYSEIVEYYKSIGYLCLKNNAEDIEYLKGFLNKKFISVSGQSGSGKSTYINKLSNNTLNLATEQTSKMLGRGKHTTRHIEFHKICDFYIADTPGFSSLDITFIAKEELKYQFLEFKDMKCKYLSCTHENEPSCKVKEYIKTNYYANERYNNYIKFLNKIKNKGKY